MMTDKGAFVLAWLVVVYRFRRTLWRLIDMCEKKDDLKHW